MAPAEDDYTQQLRQRHREDPGGFFDELLENIWMNRDEDQVRREWERLCGQAGWYVEDAIACLDTILGHPPADLVERMRERGWIMLETGRDGYLDWLADQTTQFRHIHAARGGAATARAAGT